tara:strand:+ start:800 stop:1126 length:327 start_codon:yes stop_codon:yes gene_type:complete
MFAKAYQKNLTKSGLLSDYAYTTTNCVLTKERQLQIKLFSVTNDLHNQASKSPNQSLQAYAYLSWAKPYFSQNDFTNSRTILEQAKILSGKTDALLEQSLKEKSLDHK